MTSEISCIQETDVWKGLALVQNNSFNIKHRKNIHMYIGMYWESSVDFIV